MSIQSDRQIETEQAEERLRDAAPELLKSLKLLTKETELSGNHEATDYGWPKAYQAALAAIAKAEGKKP